MGIFSWFSSSPGRIDDAISDAVGWTQRRQLIVHTIDLPAYRFVDLHNAVHAFCKVKANLRTIETRQSEGLNEIIHDKPSSWVDRSCRLSPKTAWSTGPNEEAYLPVDCFWICPSKTMANCFVIRLLFEEAMQKSRLEVACGDTNAGKRVLDEIVEHSRVHSIYRNAVLHLTYDAGSRDEYGDIEKPERFQITFSTTEPVTADDIVLAEDHIEVLRRNVLDLHQRRDILEANGIPARRGVLLHGPPGTGKTFACRFLAHKLENVTRIFVTGSSLLNIGAIFSFARLMQPSVVFLEDVDLIFAAREINLYSSALGDLLDQLDGLRPKENISVILTTNAIDRLEAAIKDRPGRISQCVYMGAPAATQRRKFIEHQLLDHNSEAVDVDLLVAESDGATQAFLKEWTLRAVQIACERLDGPAEKAAVRDADFLAALKEMRRFLDGSDGQIIGFVPRS